MLELHVIKMVRDDQGRLAPATALVCLVIDGHAVLPEEVADNIEEELPDAR